MDLAGILGDFFHALWLMLLPVAAISFGLVWWSLKNNHFGAINSLKDFEGKVKERKNAEKKRKKKKQEIKKHKKASAGSAEEDSVLAQLERDLDPFQTPKLNPVHSKWMSFGGGYYGVIALWTYTLIEMAEIRDFFLRFSGVWDFITGISINLLVNLIINSIMNFVAAITWPIYWIKEFRGDYFWIWFVVSYAAYWLGSRLAIRFYAKKREKAA